MTDETPAANERKTIGEVSGYDAAMRLKTSMASEQAAEQRATGGRRAGGVPRRAISEEGEAGRRADEVIPPARGKPE